MSGAHAWTILHRRPKAFKMSVGWGSACVNVFEMRVEHDNNLVDAI